LFDLNRDPRTVGLAYEHLLRLFEAEMERDPLLETVLHNARDKINNKEGRYVEHAAGAWT
jgi:hypothetical protein